MISPRGRGRRRQFLAGAAVTTALALLTAGCTDVAVSAYDAVRANGGAGDPGQAPRPELARFYGQQLAWQECDTGDDPDLDPGSFQCAEMTVPLSYDDPGGRTITITVTRAKADSAQGRAGSLVLNPGGPGGSGVEAAWWMREEMGSDIRRRFDVVGFDPRGVERSTPVRCYDDRMRDRLTLVDGTPDTPADVEKLDVINRTILEGCKRSGDLLGQVGTRNTARDMDVLRALLGDRKLNYVGFSYGTYLGALYAEEFPARVGRLVLDGAVDPALDPLADLEETAKGFRTAFDAFADACLAGEVERGCVFTGRTREDITAELTRLADGLDARPLAVSGGRQVDGDFTLGLVLQLLYSTDMWVAVGDVVTAARRRDGSSLIRLADLFAERDSSGKYHNNQNEAHFAITCADGGGISLPLAQVQALADRLAAQYPPFGRMIGWGAYGDCPDGSPAKRPELRVSDQVAPMLVVGTTRDPATPLEAAERLVKQLPNARLIAYDGDGHTAYLGDSTCVNAAVDAYLLDGALPPDGKRC